MKNTNEITLKILRAGVTLLGTKLEKRLHLFDESVVYDFEVNGELYTYYPKIATIVGCRSNQCYSITNKQQFVYFISQNL